MFGIKNSPQRAFDCGFNSPQGAFGWAENIIRGCLFGLADFPNGAFGLQAKNVIGCVGLAVHQKGGLGEAETTLGSEDLSDIESECDVPVCDNSTTLSNPLFDADDNFSSSDDESISNEDVLKKIYSNPLFDEEIISTKIDPHHFNAESYLIESLLNRDTLIISSPKFDSLLEEFSCNDSPSLHENESFHFDVPSSPRPPAKPPDDGIYFEPDTGVFTKVVDDISDNSTRELYVHVPNVLPTLPTLSSMFDTLLPFSSKNEDKVHLLSHRGFKTFPLSSESPMMIFGGDIPILDVPIAPDYEASRARGFVLRSLELQSLA
ncbi:hypothetical protein Tco_0657101 [Tanacetum coccineum]|uniref:Reverse transcriptase domain-containing protein n=1 Tax=Tanacetum coccineum TaxID=301880 RepID=A0ABQ4XB90_9ASTR